MNNSSRRQARTASRHIPWWVYLVAACFLASFAFDIYVSYMGYGPSGATISDATSGGARIDQVRAGMPLDKAGLRAGDIIVAVNGQAIRAAHDWDEIGWQFAPETPIAITVMRNGQKLQFKMLMSPLRAWQMLTRDQWLDRLLNTALALAYVSCGLIVLFARPRDPGAIAGAVLILLLGIFLGLAPSMGIAVLFRRMPFLLQVPAYFVPTLVGGYLVLIFSALFPRPVFRQRWLLPALVVPGLLLILNNAVRLFHRFYMPSQAIAPGPAWAFRLLLAIEMAYIITGLAVFALGYKRLSDIYERRRARRVFGAALISFSALLVYFLLLAMSGSGIRILDLLFYSPATTFVFPILWSVFPVVFAYTVLRTEKSLRSEI